VQHLLGVGHLQRALHLAKTLTRHHFEVELVSGGLPHTMASTTDFRIHQLPPLYSPDGSFSRLLDARGEVIDDRWREQRKQQLLKLFESFAPEVLITETFPFGRRMLRFELLPLLQASHDSPVCRLVIASIRDILQPRSKPGRERETCEWIEAWYDHVLVHGDPQIARLDHSFNSAERIRDKIYYSGYLCTQSAQTPTADDGRDEVLVSAGGSATGLQILSTAIEAKPLSDFAAQHWRLLVSPAIAEADFLELQRRATAGVSVERNRPDFSALVKRASLSISQAGYNTMTDILSSSTASVVIPFAEADEAEQSLRAEALQARGRLIALAQDDLNPTTLARAMTAAQASNTPLEVNLNGAENSATRIAQWLARISHQGAG
jgi:predicted glycosyltransferase